MKAGRQRVTGRESSGKRERTKEWERKNSVTEWQRRQWKEQGRKREQREEKDGRRNARRTEGARVGEAPQIRELLLQPCPQPFWHHDLSGKGRSQAGYALSSPEGLCPPVHPSIWDISPAPSCSGSQPTRGIYLWQWQSISDRRRLSTCTDHQGPGTQG